MTDWMQQELAAATAQQLDDAILFGDAPATITPPAEPYKPTLAHRLRYARQWLGDRVIAAGSWIAGYEEDDDYD